CMAETEDSLSNNWDDCRVVIVAVPPMPFVKDTLIFDVDISTEVAYYYALITIDNVGNRSLISNIVEVVKEDTTPPARTGDLSATN
ncbi:MAG: hypothetical protein KAS32_26790, partial [Candidatus Peribacteraceae bacterium]|nr:hypothetical protein [Candidatus Peribacteraceae bacterium]